MENQPEEIQEPPTPVVLSSVIELNEERIEDISDSTVDLSSCNFAPQEPKQLSKSQLRSGMIVLLYSTVRKFKGVGTSNGLTK